jgi:putative transposase
LDVVVQSSTPKHGLGRDHPETPAGHGRMMATSQSHQKKVGLPGPERNADLWQIDPGKPNQNAYIQSFNGRLRDECLNEHWVTSIDHARGVIEIWRRKYNDERPKKILGGSTPTEYAKQISTKANTLTVSL